MTTKKRPRAKRKKVTKTMTVTVTREVVTWTAWCEWCGKKMVGRRRGTKFCGGTCRVRAHRAKEEP